MRPASRSPRRRAFALALAGLACLAQSVGALLPEPVVCLRGDRPARGELFTCSCSCRHEGHDLTSLGGHAGRLMEPACVDVPLASLALPAAAGGGTGPVLRRGGPAPLPVGMPLLTAAFSIPAECRPHGRGSPPSGFPLPLPGLRC